MRNSCLRGLECEANVRVGRVLVLRPLEWPNAEVNVSDRCASPTQDHTSTQGHFKGRGIFCVDNFSVKTDLR